MRLLPGILLSVVVCATLPADAAPVPDPSWHRVDVGTTQGLRGLDAVDRDTAWVSGSAGGVWRTTDGGSTWQDVGPPDAAGLLLRDVEARDARHAQVLAIGEGEDSRILRTSDGGATWETTFVNDDPRAFYDCMAFFPGGRRGLAMSDPVDGRFRIIETTDGGSSWSVVDPAGMPPAVDGEFGFAASGTCLVTAGGRDVWLASGGAASRVFHSHDRGHTWTVSDTTIPPDAANGGGVFSLAFRNPRQGLAVGGNLGTPTVGADMAAYTRDGQTWLPAGDPGGYRSAVEWVYGAPRTALAVGPTGSDITRDGGRTWTTFSDTGFDSVQCTPDGGCWASGSGGRVATFAR
ncbi:oxidoreductase [Nocardioides guangzhouensis]|uniref:Oxidoreductase n=1 Tax=Nocardioides guangzhouensis TaxID=2497878 RepID=A0A4Q4ZLK6_9ACTN|nr:oxidoreductase [Nocardioides guangzhouensis]RYP88334.1 oxidoreductase [Nocardioides guangzhouensis]